MSEDETIVEPHPAIEAKFDAYLATTNGNMVSAAILTLAEAVYISSGLRLRGVDDED